MRTRPLALAGLVAVIATALYLGLVTFASRPTPLSRPQLIRLMDSGRLVAGTIHLDPRQSVLIEITGRYRDSADRIQYFWLKTPVDEALLIGLIDRGFRTRERSNFPHEILARARRLFSQATDL